MAVLVMATPVMVAAILPPGDPVTLEEEESLTQVALPVWDTLGQAERERAEDCENAGERVEEGECEEVPLPIHPEDMDEVGLVETVGVGDEEEGSVGDTLRTGVAVGDMEVEGLPVGVPVKAGESDGDTLSERLAVQLTVAQSVEVLEMVAVVQGLTEVEADKVGLRVIAAGERVGLDDTEGEKEFEWELVEVTAPSVGDNEAVCETVGEEDAVGKVRVNKAEEVNESVGEFVLESVMLGEPVALDESDTNAEPEDPLEPLLDTEAE